MSAEAGRRSPYASVFAAAAAEIATVYQKVLFRAPTPRDLQKHLDCFLQKCGTPERAAEVVRDRTLLRTHLGIRPLFVEMDVINKCNLRCIMCYFSNDTVYKAQRDEIAVEDFARLAEEMLPFCYNFSFSTGAEPLLHRRLGDLLDTAARYEVPNSLMYTNGLLLYEPIVERMIASKLTTLYVSIDGATKETYERIRVGGNFDKLMTNLRAFQSAKERAGSWTPDLNINLVLMRSNIRELPAMVRLAADLGAVGVTTCHVYNRASARAAEETLDQDKDLCNRMFDEARAEAEKLGLPVFLPAKFATAQGRAPLPLDLLSERERFKRWNGEVVGYLRDHFAGDEVREHCQFPWNFLAILWSGDVHPCASWSEEPVGNIRTQSFDEIWNGAKLRALRAEHASGSLRKLCRECTAFGMGNVDSPTAFSSR